MLAGAKSELAEVKSQRRNSSPKRRRRGLFIAMANVCERRNQEGYFFDNTKMLEDCIPQVLLVRGDYRQDEIPPKELFAD